MNTYPNVMQKNNKVLKNKLTCQWWPTILGLVLDNSAVPMSPSTEFIQRLPDFLCFDFSKTCPYFWWISRTCEFNSPVTSPSNLSRFWSFLLPQVIFSYQGAHYVLPDFKFALQNKDNLYTMKYLQLEHLVFKFVSRIGLRMGQDPVKSRSEFWLYKLYHIIIHVTRMAVRTCLK